MDSSTDATALVSVDDAALREDVRRTAAAADCALAEPTGEIDRTSWTRAQLVVLDAVAAQRCARLGLQRRHGVVVVCNGEPTLPDWQSASAIGAESVLALPHDEARLVDVLGAQPEAGSGEGIVVAVAGGIGGAGASTFAATLALLADATEVRPATLLVDGDGAGGGIDLLLGVEERGGLRWPGLVLEGGRVAASALHNALPQVGDHLAVLACGRGESAGDPGHIAIQAVLEAARGAGDFVVCDVPRRHRGETDAMLEAADLVLLTVPAELRASAAAEAVATYIGERNANQGLIVRGPAPGGLSGADIASALGLPLLAAMRPEPRLADTVELGGLRLRRRGPLRTAAQSVLDVIAARPATRRWVA
ncbi:septum site-determining protein Ssd [Antrihabitans cavernicola]|uniref:Rv3660c-like CheY-like N-terminal domain-containing protein n=1 Tax=Antrihabitans cavernicola TaxID=2495913 RepID=A0A5A7SIM9_9NOCA|nr:septum site-determining protein Ssd [Spelaeibacter cavernicola]KAA0024453.1 hypothetical protein FOY51_00330 [Spelaeibacter cavernicola]